MNLGRRIFLLRKKSHPTSLRNTDCISDFLLLLSKNTKSVRFTDKRQEDFRVNRLNQRRPGTFNAFKIKDPLPDAIKERFDLCSLSRRCLIFYFLERTANGLKLAEKACYRRACCAEPWNEKSAWPQQRSNLLKSQRIIQKNLNRFCRSQWQMPKNGRCRTA